MRSRWAKCYLPGKLRLKRNSSNIKHYSFLNFFRGIAKWMPCWSLKLGYPLQYSVPDGNILRYWQPFGKFPWHMCNYLAKLLINAPIAEVEIAFGWFKEDCHYPPDIGYRIMNVPGSVTDRNISITTLDIYHWFVPRPIRMQKGNYFAL